VIGDWYVSVTSRCSTAATNIGMLYVGFLEQPFMPSGWRWRCCSCCSPSHGGNVGELAFARSVIAPVERLRRTMSAVAAGRLDARVGALPQQDELALLAAHFDALLARLESQNQAMLRWAGELDDKVAERTRELAAANHTLLSAQQQLFKSENCRHRPAGGRHRARDQQPVAVVRQPGADAGAARRAAAPVLPEIT
jgi:HAMP domain-containing protein